ncbi:hypothetical protein HX017_06900 [Myroides marinus]|uniref:hypothetical protein n=1 Tax=Myroides marinus TaxID=703342 RepID=UPI002574C343|nr:hypothetical protein [Myroides marinus]MDM1350040.1 hypothetical protein [Myroides marinus]MDM1357247.1 hypothetical protein [Myroides marinus]MDM1364675.1 hypothetical protein [Myroides marinus]MDM1531613.1 hypothetical protein [Myroides marinus]MDM1538660.1 hypothetical protein [Myroides marinus]
MKKNIITLLAVVLSATAFAQKPGVGIGTKKVNASAALQVDATNKGVLIPRVDLKALVTADTTNKYGLLGTPEQGVLVYNKIASPEYVEGFFYWAGGKWEAVTSETKLEKVVTDTKTELQREITEKITEITKVPGDPNDPTDLSYMVAFKPDALKPGENETDPRKGTLQYLVPKEIDDPKNPGKKKTIYEKRIIGFADLVTGSETETNISKFYGDGNTSTKQAITVAIPEAVAKTKGKIYYTYVNEKNVTEYLDVTSDFETIIKENETIRKEITNVVKTVDPIDPTKPDPVKPVDPTKPDPGAYGNVYYGDPYKEGKPVLYSVDDKGVVHYINLSQNIINEITNNQEIIEKLKETIRVEVGKEKDKDVPTGEVIGGRRVFKGLATIVVPGVAANGEYDSEFTGSVTVHPTKVTIKDNKATVEEDAAVKFGRLLSVSVLTQGGSVLVNSATDVEKIGEKAFKFSFGTGSLYTPVLGGTYDLVFEYLEQ